MDIHPFNIEVHEDPGSLYNPNGSLIEIDMAEIEDEDEDDPELIKESKGEEDTVEWEKEVDEGE